MMLVFSCFILHLYTTAFPDGRGAEEKTLLSPELEVYTKQQHIPELENSVTDLCGAEG